MEDNLSTHLIINTLNRVEGKVDDVQKTQAEHGSRIAVLETTVPAAAAEAAKTAVDAHIAARRKSWIGWGSAVGTIVAGAFEIVHRYLSK